MTEPNVVPEEEMNRRRRTNEIADDVAVGISELRAVWLQLVEQVKEAQDLRCDLPDFVGLVIDRVPDEIRALVKDAMASGVAGPIWDRIGSSATAAAFGKLFTNDDPVDDDRHDKMKKLLKRLLADAPKIGAEGTASAIECQILLNSGYQAVGALSVSPEGLLRFMAIARDPRDPKNVVAAEHFFDYEDLQAIVIPRAHVQEQQRSPIVMG